MKERIVAIAVFSILLLPLPVKASPRYTLVVLLVPYHIQEENYFCGPACVQMVLEYFDYSVSQYTLALEMNTKPVKGTYTSKMPLPFTKRGFRVVTRKPMSIKELKSFIREGKPVIILIWFDTRKKSQHYVVVCGYNATGVFIHDPWYAQTAQGRKVGPFVYLNYSMLNTLWKCSYPFWGEVVDYTQPLLVLSFSSSKDTEVKLFTRIYGVKFTQKVSLKEKILIGFKPGPLEVSVSDHVNLSDKTRLIFSRWSDGVKEASREISVKEPKVLKLTAIYKLQHYLSVYSKYGSVKGSGWYDNGATAVISVNTNIIQLSENTRILLIGWKINNKVVNTSETTIKYKVVAPAQIEALWAREYYIKVESEYGKVSGSGWYREGSVATISLDTTRVDYFFTYYEFSGWIDESGQKVSEQPVYSFKVTSPKHYKAVWVQKLNIPLIVGVIAALVALVLLLIFLLVKHIKGNTRR
ncbi:MAG: hypothetical protein DRJ52_05195 [Thermoprotei archaeon]|nr:MAG: hypothetical protein DRJ52_05195 [Thermoprotei archaeon]RLF00082.1 MAG: hypothetical protein DRJ63_03570 [Thermoprotei archaeon]